MKRLQISEPLRDYAGFTHKFIVDYTDITAAALTNTITLLPASGLFPSTLAILRTAYKLVTPFTGGAVATVTLTLGDPGTAARYIAAASTDLLTALATNTKMAVFSNNAYAYNTADAAANCKLRALFTSTVANLDALTAGQIEIYAQIIDMANLKLPV
jgi:hypothetical protein